MKTKLIERVLKTVRNYRMIAPGDTVLAAVSGGPDSVFLLRVLLALRNKLKIKKIAVCHLDHGLRGEDSAADADFVKKLAEDLSLEYYHGWADLARGASKKLSTEERARQARYAFYGNCAARSGANVVATGHTLDDQAETVLMRIVKGSSLKGAVGILPVRQQDNIRFIRPLIELEKSEITGFLEKAGACYRIDRTNLESIYFRNVVRREILPFLAKYNPRIKRALSSFAEHLREDYEFIESCKGRFFENIGVGKDGEVILPLKEIVIQPKALQKEIFRDALGRAGGDIKRLTFRHWKDLERFVRDKRSGDSMDLPGAIRVERTGQDLVFRSGKKVS